MIILLFDPTESQTWQQILERESLQCFNNEIAPPPLNTMSPTSVSGHYMTGTDVMGPSDTHVCHGPSVQAIMFALQALAIIFVWLLRQAKTSCQWSLQSEMNEQNEGFYAGPLALHEAQ